MSELRSDAYASIFASRIIMAISEEYGMDPMDVLGKSRRAELALVRHIAIYFLRHAGFSWETCAKALGRADHSTAINSYYRADGLLFTGDPMTARMASIARRVSGISIAT